MPSHLIKLQIRDSSQSGFHINLSMLRSQEDFDSVDGFLTTSPPELIAAFNNWHDSYCQLGAVRQWRISPRSVSTSSNCLEYREQVKHYVNEWLNNSGSQWVSFRERLIYLSSQLRNSAQEIGFLLDAGENQLNHFPLREWKFLDDHFPDTEIALRVRGDKPIQSPPKTNCIRILMVIGTTEGLNTNQDLQIINRLENQGAEVKTLVTPTQTELFKTFREDDAYDIFVFSGHSESDDEDKIGYLYINDSLQGRINIENFKNNFRCLIKKGLQLAIFNSCDGLGLAHQLAKLNLPRCIVMREPVPDPVAIRFIEEFFRNFTQNYPLFRCVNSAKISLEEFDQKQKYPGAMWLPTLCTRESAALKPLTWQALQNDKASNQEKNKRVKSHNKFNKNNDKFNLKYLLFGALGVLLIALILWLLNPKYRDKNVTRDCPKSSILLPEKNSENLHCLAYIADVPKGTIWHGASTTWAPIRRDVNSKIQEIFPEFNLTYKSHPTLPPGSQTGIQMLLKGQLVFAESSRPLKEDELQEAHRRGFQLRQIPVAIDAIAFVVHPDLDISGLSMNQLQKIYLGEVKNWKEVGGQNLEIIPYSRPETGGTTRFFKDNILDNQDFGDNIVEIQTTTEAIRKVAQNPGGIYYASAPELVPQCTVKPLPILQSSGELIAPYKGSLVPPEDCPEQRNQLNTEAFQNNLYPITRKIFVIVKLDDAVDERAGEAYAELLLTDEGQDLIQEAGFIPLR